MRRTPELFSAQIALENMRGCAVYAQLILICRVLLYSLLAFFCGPLGQQLPIGYIRETGNSHSAGVLHEIDGDPSKEQNKIVMRGGCCTCAELSLPLPVTFSQMTRVLLTTRSASMPLGDTLIRSSAVVVPTEKIFWSAINWWFFFRYLLVLLSHFFSWFLGRLSS